MARCVGSIPTATAYPHREPGYNLVLVGQWLDPAETAANVNWVKETYDALEAFMAPRSYVNYLADDESDRVVNAYGPNLQPPRGDQASLRPCQPLPAQPQHRSRRLSREQRRSRGRGRPRRRMDAQGNAGCTAPVRTRH